MSLSNVPVLTLVAALLIAAGCSATDSSDASGGGDSLASRVTDTEWACTWRGLAPVNGDRSNIEAVQVAHTLSFTATTLRDDFPEQLRAWAGDDSWRSTVAAQSVYAGITSVDFNLDDVTWAPFSSDEILVEMAGEGGFHLFDVMTIKWDGDGMWYATQVGPNRSRCTRTSPPVGDTGS